MPGKFKNLSYVPRGTSNLGGFARLVLFAATDFTAGWPKKADITAGETTVAPPLAAGVVGAELSFDNESSGGKSMKKGKLGYQNMEHEVDAKFAGYDVTSADALEKFLNEGGVAVGYYKNGKRQVFGASWNPLEIEESSDSGKKADDGASVSFKAKGSGYDFHAPFLGAAVILPTDTAAVKPMPF